MHHALTVGTKTNAFKKTIKDIVEPLYQMINVGKFLKDWFLSLVFLNFGNHKNANLSYSQTQMEYFGFETIINWFECFEFWIDFGFPKIKHLNSCK